MKTIRQSKIANIAMLTLGAILASTTPSVNAQESPKQWRVAETGYNALEVAANVSGSEANKARTRLYTNVGITNGSTTYAFSGTNQITGTDSQTYFGDNKLLAGNSDISATARMVTTTQGIVDTKFGLQTQALTKPLHATYTRADVTFNGKGIQVETLYGKVVNAGTFKDWTLEAFHALTIPRSGKTGNYTELQVYTPALKELGAVKGFVRAEIPSFKPQDGNYLIGVVKSF